MILVTGATGHVGSVVVATLAGQERPVRALVRRHTPVPDGAEVAVGDFNDPATLAAALQGVDTVVLVSPAVVAEEIALIDAAAAAGVSHLVKISSKASAHSPVERRRGQAEIEDRLKSTAMAWTILRSNAYMQNLMALAPQVAKTGGFVMSAGDGESGMIDAADTAAVAALVAADPASHAGRTYWLTGPTLVTYDAVAADLSEALARPVEYRRLSPEQHEQVMLKAGLAPAVAASNARAFSLLADGDGAWLTDDVEVLIERAPRDLHSYLHANLAAFR